MAQKGIIMNTIKEGHVDASDFAEILQGMLVSDGILDFEEKLKISKINNNTVRIKSGIFNLRGHMIKVSNYEDLTIESGTLGTKRYDYIIAEYKKNGIETGTDTLHFRILKGTPSTTTAIRPSLTNNATVYQARVFEVFIEGTELSILTDSNKVLSNDCEFISNESQECWKYSNGLLIIKTRRYFTDHIVQPWGAMFISNPIPGVPYLIPFVDEPSCSHIVYSLDNNHLIWMGTANNYNELKTTTPRTYLIKEVKTAMSRYSIQFTSVGRWK